MRRIVTAATAMSLLACGLASQPYQLDVPYGMHGPTYSHQRNNPNVWEHAQTTFDAFHQLGMGYARMDVWWGLVEPEQGLWEFDYFDRAIQSYADNDIALMVILGYGAAWENGAGPITDESREAFGEYVYRMVSRYGHIVREWEVWNEPNILPFWAPEPDAADYAALLRVAYDRAKEADPNCVIIGGAMAGPDQEFLRGIFEHGAGDSFDVLSYHNYGNRIDRAGVRREVNGLREILEDNGRGDTPIWLSEHGIFTGPGGVPERDQARDIVRVAIWRWAEGVDRLVYLSLRDWFADENSPSGRDFWGFLTAEGEPKESFYAMHTMLQNLTDRPYRGELHLADGVEAFLFGGRQDNVVAIWSDEAMDFTLDAGVTHLITETLLGEETFHTSDSREFTLALTSDPMWLHDVGDNLVLQSHLQAEPVALARGEEVDLDIGVSNPLDRSVALEVRAAAPEGLTLSGVPTHVILEPGGDVDISIGIAAGEEAPIGEIALPITVAVDGPPLPVGEIRELASVTVADPFLVAMLPTTSLDEEGRYPLRFGVTNLTGSPIDVDARVMVGDTEAASAAQTIDETGEIALALDLDLFTAGELSEARAEFSAVDHTVELDDSLRLFLVPALRHEVLIDGDLSEWTGEPTFGPEQFTEEDFNPNLNRGTDDMAITGWMAWTTEGLCLAIEVQDDVIALSDAHTIWDFDSLQVALDTRHDAKPNEGFNYDDMEIEIALMRDGSLEIFAGQYPPGRIEEIVAQETQLAVASAEGVIRYEMLLPAGVLDPMPLEAGAVAGFNFIQNDNDGEGREGWFELAPGIGWGKQPELYPAIVLMP